MKVWELHSENFKKLNVRLALNGKSVTVTGDNETGKSSFIDAIFKTLTGEKIKGEPVQLGKNKAVNKIVIRKDSGETITVERTYADNRQTLIVKLNNSSKVSSPQKFLDETLGQISFDPLQFVNKTPLEQKRFLMELLDINLDEFEIEKRKLLDEVQIVDRDLTRISGELENLPLPDKEYKFIDPSDIVKESEKINELTNNKNILQYEIETYEKDLISIDERKTYILNEIERLNSKLKELLKDYSDTEKDLSSKKAELDKIVIPETDSLESQLKEIQLNNDMYKAQQERLTKQREYEEVETSKVDVQAKIRKLEKDRNKKLSEVKMPIEGLEFLDDGLSYNGLKLTEDNISTSRIIEIGIRISMALHPALRIMQIKDGSLLGKNMLETIKNICKEKDYQLFIEKVTDSKEIGFQIEEEPVK